MKIVILLGTFGSPRASITAIKADTAISPCSDWYVSTRRIEFHSVTGLGSRRIRREKILVCEI